MNTVADQTQLTTSLGEIAQILTKISATMAEIEPIIGLDHILLLVAGEERTTKYAHAATALFMAPGLARFSRALGNKTELDHKRGWPLFCSLVVSKETDRPGRGFFEQAKNLGYVIADEDDFLKTQQLKCFAFVAERRAAYGGKARPDVARRDAPSGVR